MNDSWIKFLFGYALIVLFVCSIGYELAKALSVFILRHV